MKANKKIKMYSLKTAKHTKKKAKGFTLVELIVVIAIIGILAVVLVPNMMKYVRNAGLTKVNDSASKIAEQANLIASDMESQGKALSGTYTAAELSTLTGADNSHAADFATALKAAVDISVQGGNATSLNITFDSTTGQVAYVVYQPDEGGYVGLYPNPSDRDGSSDSAKDWTKAIKEVNGTATQETEAEE